MVLLARVWAVMIRRMREQRLQNVCLVYESTSVPSVNLTRYLWVICTSIGGELWIKRRKVCVLFMKALICLLMFSLTQSNLNYLSVILLTEPLYVPNVQCPCHLFRFKVRICWILQSKFSVICTVDFVHCVYHELKFQQPSSLTFTFQLLLKGPYYLI